MATKASQTSKKSRPADETLEGTAPSVLGTRFHPGSDGALPSSSEAKVGFKRQCASNSGVALVVTLITLSILVVLLVGFTASMSLERQAAHSFEETQRAKLVAQGAVSHAVDLLRTNIPEPALLSETTAA